MAKETDWKTRVKSKSFWVSLVAAILLLVQSIAALFGYQWDAAALNQQLTAFVNAVFSVLAVLGIVSDPSVGWMEEGDSSGE